MGRKPTIEHPAATLQRCTTSITHPIRLARAAAPDTVGRISNLLEEGTELSAVLTAFSADRAVRIISIRKSKGLEFDTVIMMGVEEETFWGKIDEERSAHFVGISRTKNRLLLTVCDHRDRPEGAPRWNSERTAHAEFLEYAETYA